MVWILRYWFVSKTEVLRLKPMKTEFIDTFSYCLQTQNIVAGGLATINHSKSEEGTECVCMVP